MKLVQFFIFAVLLAFVNSLKAENEVLLLNLNEIKNLEIESIVDSSAIIPDYPYSYTIFKFNFENRYPSVDIKYYYESNQIEKKYPLFLNRDNNIKRRGGGWIGQGMREGEEYEYGNDTINVIGIRTDSGIDPESTSETIRRFIVEDSIIKEKHFMNVDLPRYIILEGGCPGSPKMKVDAQKSSESYYRQFYLYNEDWKWIGCFDVDNDAMLDSMREYGYKEFTKKFVWNEDYEGYFNKRIRDKAGNNDDESDFYINGEPAYEFLKGKIEPVPDYLTITIYPDFYFTIKVK